MGHDYIHIGHIRHPTQTWSEQNATLDWTQNLYSKNALRPKIAI
jgi:hypothetical protein